MTVTAPREDGVMAYEEEQACVDQWTNMKHGAVGDHGESLGCGCVDEVGIAAGDCADFFWLWCRPDAGGNGGVAEAEGAGGEEGLCGLGRGVNGCFFPGPKIGTWGTRRVRADEDFEGAAFYFFGVARINEVACGENNGPSGKDLGLPAVVEAEVDNRGGDRSRGWGTHRSGL